MSYASIQTEQTPVRTAECPRAYVRYLYSPSKGSLASLAKGQDYLAWDYDEEEDALVFVLCDGVSSSFFGDIAAKFLAEHLLKELLGEFGQELAAMDNDQVRTNHVVSRLNGWVQDVRKEVADVDISRFSTLRQEIYSRLRNEHGSQTVFISGRVDFSDPEPSLILIWMGNATGYLFNENAEPTAIDGEWHDGNRWSSKEGVRGKLFLRTQALAASGIKRIMAASDGLKWDGEGDGERRRIPFTELLRIDNMGLRKLVDQELRHEDSDDISFIDIHLKPLDPPEELLPAPELTIEKTILSWSSVDGAASFEIQESRDGLFYRPIEHGENKSPWSIPTIEEDSALGCRYFRVRALSGSARSGWSLCKRLPLEAPELTIIDISDIPRSYEVRWNAVPGAYSYDLVEVQPSNGSRQIISFPSGTDLVQRFSDKPAGYYEYQVYAVGADGTRSPSNPKKKEITPVLSEGSTEQRNTITLRWEVNTGEICVVRRVDRQDSVVVEEVYKGSETKCTLLNLSQGDYYFQIQLLNSEFWSPACKVAVSPPEILDTPKLLDPLWVSPSVTVRWLPVPGANKYKLQKGSKDNHEDIDVSKTQHEFTPFEDTYYRVKAVGEARQDSEWSEWDAIQVKTHDIHSLDTPQFEHWGYKNGFVFLEWTNVRNAMGYELEENKSQLSRRIVGRHHENLLRSSGRYSYRVRAYARHAESGFSSYVTIIIPDIQLLIEEPSPLQQFLDYVEFSLTCVQDLVRYPEYIFQVADNKDFSDPTLISPTILSPNQNKCDYRVSGPGTFFFRVIVRDTATDQKFQSEPVFKTVTLLRPEWKECYKKPKNNKKGEFLYTVMLRWEKVRWATGYKLRTTEINSGKPKETTIPATRSKVVQIPWGDCRLGESYEFEVQAITSQGIEGPWSTTMRLETGRDQNNSPFAKLNEK